MRFGDIVMVDLGTPAGSEAGFVRPAVICTSTDFLRFQPTTLFVTPLTTTRRDFPSHVAIEPDEFNGLRTRSYAQVEQMRAISLQRCGEDLGHVGPVQARQIVDIISMIIGT